MNINILKSHQGRCFCLFHLLLKLWHLEQSLTQSQCSVNVFRRRLPLYIVEERKALPWGRSETGQGPKVRNILICNQLCINEQR